MLLGVEVEYEHAMHQKYGEVVRLGPDRLTYITPAGLERHFRLRSRKTPRKDQRLHHLLEPTITGDFPLGPTYDTAEHRARRRNLRTCV
ncbi:cytochrome p450 [Pyrenophora seminiperda CCB06]|uniref:Cytochrome p450 n=1 Tax=Pyrenophora seminiperda CCB06 TaxID=1302712 RepID=A0A3M7MGC3_9PLEO|nr:cytochrome p450 [Pyrenophora seminiperda CCB06]